MSKDLEHEDLEPKSQKRRSGRPKKDVEAQEASPPEAQEPAPKKTKPVRTGPGCLSRTIGLVGIVVLVGLIVAFLAGLKYSTNFLPQAEESREVVVTIPAGSSPAKIAEILERQKVIRSADAFVWAVKIKSKLGRKAINLKAGEMALDPSLSAWQTVDLVAKGNFKLYPFTVPEGRNMAEIAQAVEAAGLGSQADFLALCRDQAFINSLGLSEDNLEGYLFPETYNFPKGTPLKTIIKAMVDRFWAVWAKYEDQLQGKNLTRHEIVTLASIVEKETGAPAERPMIAGVFMNRLSKGMRLETDPTVVYGLTNYSGRITKKDLQTAHPYNTYIIPGLPPGPIANPGEAALSAVIKPSRVTSLFFVSKNDGTHHFSDTLAEHNKMVNQYQRGGGSAQ